MGFVIAAALIKRNISYCYVRLALKMRLETLRNAYCLMYLTS